MIKPSNECLPGESIEEAYERLTERFPIEQSLTDYYLEQLKQMESEGGRAGSFARSALQFFEKTGYFTEVQVWHIENQQNQILIAA